jgi:hypothetical protein
MRRPPVHPCLVLLAAVLVAGACRGSDGATQQPTPVEGHLVLEWRGGARVMDAPAQATYCAGDSLLLIFAVDRRWGAGLLLHGRFPVDSTRTFTVRPSLGDDGTATAAFRPVADSVQRAVIALRGTVRLEPGGRATGRFEVGAAPLPGRSDPVHLVGAFRGLPATDTSATCSAWSRTP